MRMLWIVACLSCISLAGCATFSVGSKSTGDAVEILLDNSGIDPSFTNPARVRSAGDKSILFRNITLDRTIEVTLHLIVDPGTVFPPGTPNPTCRRVARSNGVLAVVQQMVGTGGSNTVEAEGPDRLLCDIQYTLPPRSVQAIGSDVLREASETPIRFTVKFYSDDERPAYSTGYIDYWLDGSPPAPAADNDVPPVPVPPTIATTEPPFEIVLENDGVAQPSRRNARRPAAVFKDKTDESQITADELRGGMVVFKNNTDRGMTVTIPVRLDPDKLKEDFGKSDPVGSFRRRYQAFLTGCQPTGDTRDTISCDFQVRLDGRRDKTLGLLLLSLSPDRPIRFRVSFTDPAGNQDKPAQPFGFMRLANVMPVIPDRFSLQVSGSIERVDDSFLGLPDATGLVILQESAPYEGERRNFYSATGRVDFNYSLSDRATGRLRLAFKDGTVGAKSDNKVNALTAPEYEFQVFGSTGLSLRFGKLTFAQPAAPLALREKGEGVSLIFNRWSLTQMLRRESFEGIPDSEDDDSQALVFQILKMPIRAPFFRTYSLFASYGEEEGRMLLLGGGAEELTAWDYQTVGGEVNLVAPAQFFGNVSAFWSSRKVKEGSLPNGDGRSWLVDATWIPTFQEGHHSLTAVFGEGSGDDPRTRKNEGYVGETGAFSRDSIFLSKIAPGIRVEEIRNPVAGGLSNKRYFSLQYGHNAFSPLALFARYVLQIDKADIASRSTNLKYHDYSLQEPFLGSRDAGQELDLEFLAETPKGVKVSLMAAYFRPGRSLQTFLHDDVWSISAKVSIEP